MRVKFGWALSGDLGLATGLDDPVATNPVNRVDCVLEPFRPSASMTDFFSFEQVVCERPVCDAAAH